jgi:hypothetical protein
MLGNENHEAVLGTILERPYLELQQNPIAVPKNSLRFLVSIFKPLLKKTGKFSSTPVPLSSETVSVTDVFPRSVRR